MLCKKEAGGETFIRKEMRGLVCKICELAKNNATQFQQDNGNWSERKTERILQKKKA